VAPLADGLGLLSGSCCPHYDGEAQRRPTYQRLVGAGDLLDGWAADDGTALVFDGETMSRAVASRPHANVYRVQRTPDGVSERSIQTSYLGR
jgi:dipeptidase E